MNLNIDSVPDGDRIERHHAAVLVAYAASIDPRIQQTDGTVDVWHDALAGGTFGRARQMIVDYYRRYDPKVPDRHAITPGWIRHAAKLAVERSQNRARALNSPPPRKGRRMSRQTLEHFQRSGILLDRDPDEYEYR